MRISDWSSDVCSSDLSCRQVHHHPEAGPKREQQRQVTPPHRSGGQVLNDAFSVSFVKLPGRGFASLMSTTTADGRLIHPGERKLQIDEKKDLVNHVSTFAA